MGRRVRRSLLLAAVLVAAAVVYVVVQLLRPVPALAVTTAAPDTRALPGTAPRLAWPDNAQAAIGVLGVGPVAVSGDNREQAIASLAKMMTANVVLRDHPLRPGANGPTLTVSAAAAATYLADKNSGDSVMKVVAGEKLTERQALEGLLLPSGDNIASLLAVWDAGSVPAFVAKMNARARALGMDHTHYADASGVDPATVSTAGDQLTVALADMRVPALRQIVAMPQATVPVAGTIYNVNYALGRDGIVGVKTGSTPQAGGCLAFAADRAVAGRTTTVVGVVMGVQPTRATPSELNGATADSEKLLNSVAGHLERVRLVAPGTKLGTLHGGWTSGTPLVATGSLAVDGWAGIPVSDTVSSTAPVDAVTAGRRVATATVRVGGRTWHVPLVARNDVAAPSLAWRLTRV